jgi:cob(I)alamin adenosyltransferase
MKSSDSSGEVRAAERLGLPVRQVGLSHWLHDGEGTAEEREAARAGLEVARETLLSGESDFVILDELAACVFFGLLDLDDALDFFSSKPAPVELVITGRGAPRDTIKKADLVTEMCLHKHYFDGGVHARKGIEF